MSISDLRPAIKQTQGGSAKPETEWVSAAGDFSPGRWRNHPWRLASIDVKLPPVVGLPGRLYRDQA